jgi:ATP-dependent HslUV protease subunit HslV
MLTVVDHNSTLLVSGTGDVISPTDGIVAIGSGGNYAMAAARALCKHSNLTAAEIVEAALGIAADIDIYTNHNIIIQTLESTVK